MRLLLRSAWVWVVILGCGVTAVALGQVRSDASFSRRELSLIERGELVVRRDARVVRGHKMVGGTSWVRVRRPADAVYRAATDFARWRRFVPRAVESRPVRRGRAANVLLRHVYGPVDASYELEVRTEPAARNVRFTLDPRRPHTISAAWGYIRVIPRGAGSLVSYGIMVDVGDGVVRALFEEQVQRWALRVPDELRRWVESPEGRRRYGG